MADESEKIDAWPNDFKKKQEKFEDSSELPFKIAWQYYHSVQRIEVKRDHAILVEVSY